MKTTIEGRPQTRSERRERSRLHKGLVRLCRRNDIDVVASRSKKERKNERVSKEERWQLLYQ